MRRLLPLVILLTLASAVRADITSNLEAWWKLDDNSTTTAVDSSGGHTLTLVNTPTPGTAKIGLYSLGFASASSESGNTTTWANIQGTGAKTTAFWFNTSTATGGIISWGESTTAGKAWREAIVSGAIMLRCNSNSRSWGSGLNDGGWHHAVVVKPASANVTTTICYIDGTLASPVSTSGTDTINLGSSWNPNVAYDQGTTDGYYNGSLDDVRIYSRALSAADVTELYNWRGISYGRARVVNAGGTVQKQSQSALVHP